MLISVCIFFKLEKTSEKNDVEQKKMPRNKKKHGHSLFFSLNVYILLEICIQISFLNNKIGKFIHRKIVFFNLN